MDRQRVSFTLGKRLRELRENRGLSHVELIKQLNKKYGVSISRDSIMAYEISDKSRAKAEKLPNMGMRVEFIYCLADFYEVSLDYLFGRAENPVPDINIRKICEQTGLSVKSIEILQQLDSNKDFLVLLINNLIYQSWNFQPAARFAARYWIQGEIGDSDTSKETLWLERMCSFMRQESLLRRSDSVSSFAEIPAKDAGDFYRDRAIREIEGIALQSIEKYRDEFRTKIEEMRKISDKIMDKLDLMQKLYLLASNSALNDVLGDEFKGVPELNALCEKFESTQTDAASESTSSSDK